MKNQINTAIVCNENVDCILGVDELKSSNVTYMGDNTQVNLNFETAEPENNSIKIEKQTPGFTNNGGIPDLSKHDDDAEGSVMDDENIDEQNIIEEEFMVKENEESSISKISLEKPI